MFLRLSMILLLLLSACSGSGNSKDNPADLMEEAESAIDSGKYQIAIEKLRELKNRFPYSQMASLAQLRMADVYYLQDSFAEAAVSYELFRELYPQHEKSAYASYRIGKSWSLDSPENPARDQTSAKKAIDAFSEYLNRYSGHENNPEARKDIEILKNRLAAKELTIAKFYIREEKWSAAKARLAKISQEFPDSEFNQIAVTLLPEVEKNLEKERIESED